MKKPIVLVIMDGVGRGDGGPGDAVKQANTPTLDKLMATCPMTWLKAHGTAVGLPTDDDMGNSEVGHNALGCGQIYSQGAKLVQESIETGSLYQSKTWVDLTDNCLQNDKALHFIGLLSDGNVHSNISHLIAMLKKAREMGLKKVYCHILLDGRDVPATSALDYVDQLETVLAELRQTFRPEFLNRIDDIIVFRALTEQNIEEVARRMLKTVADRMETMDIHLDASDEAVKELAKEGFDPKYGARPLRRAIQSKVEDAVAEKMLDGTLKTGDTAKLAVEDDKLVVTK